MGVVGSWKIALDEGSDAPSPARQPRPRAVRYLVFTLLVALLAFAYWWSVVYLEPLTRWDVAFYTQVEALVAAVLGLGYLGIPLVMVLRRKPRAYWWCWGAILLLAALGSLAAVVAAALAALFVSTLPGVRAYYGLEPQHAFTVRLRHLLFY